MSQQPPVADARLATEVAGKSLSTLSQLVTEQNYRAMGFESAGEAADATLGAPIPVYLVQLDELRAYAGGDPAALLRPLQQVVFPVNVDGATRSGITVENADKGWQASGFGSPALTRGLVDAIRASGAAEPMAVHVAALRTYFIGFHAGDGTLMFAPIRDEPEFEFRAGAAVPATQALLALRPAALRYNGLPL
ncbi:hypothetical protein [Luteimonas kalidii]|uniref:Uncharacterized protein n=1 Tax=Luteimonas kalidii TaxID=3042025 RepID=A0ABT6JX40_9GAMM|nr:hypothetical protein [Luteimonas kalidii]MDH5835264.1 hypothetical protein [Luteimonas kalidii]